MEYELYRDMAFRCLNKWMCNREDEKHIGDYLNYKGINTIGIYGHGLMGKHLLAELKNSNIEILWIMDQRDLDIPYKTVHIEDAKEIEMPDLIIVTPIKGYEEIDFQLKGMGFENIRGIQEIVEVINSWRNR